MATIFDARSYGILLIEHDKMNVEFMLSSVDSICSVSSVESHGRQRSEGA